MIQKLRSLLTVFFCLLSYQAASAETLEDVLRAGNYSDIVAAWEDGAALDANTTGLTYFAAYYTSSNPPLESVAARFDALRPDADPDLLGVGLGDLRVLHNEMQVAPFLEGAERRTLFEKAHAEAARLKGHPAAEVAAYAAFYEAFLAAFDEQHERAKQLIATAKHAHAVFLEANRDWRLKALEIELVVATITGETQVALRIFSEFSFSQLTTGTSFELGFVDALANGLLAGNDAEIARAFVEDFIARLVDHPNPSTRYWRAYNLAYAVGTSPHGLMDLSERLYALAGQSAVLTDDITSETVNFAIRFEMVGEPPEYLRAYLTPIVNEMIATTPSDPYAGRLLSSLSNAEAELGNADAALVLAQSAVAQPVSEETAALLREAETLPARAAFSLLEEETSRFWTEADLARDFAVLERLYALALEVEEVDPSDRIVSVSLYASLLHRLRETSKSDAVFSAFIDRMRELEAVDATTAQLAYSSYQDHLQDIGKFSKAAAVERDLERATVRRGLQDLSAEIKSGQSSFLSSWALETASEQRLEDDLLDIALLAERLLLESDPGRTVPLAAVAIEARLHLGNLDQVAALADRAIETLLGNGLDLPSLFDLQFAVSDQLPDLDAAIDTASDLAWDLRNAERDHAASRQRYCPQLIPLPVSATALGCGAEARPSDAPAGPTDGADRPVEGGDRPGAPLARATGDVGPAERKTLLTLQRAVAEAPIGGMLDPLLAFQSALNRIWPENSAAMAEVDAGLAIAYAAANDTRAGFHAERALEAYVLNGLLTVPHVYQVLDHLPGEGMARIARIEALRPEFQSVPGTRQVEAWLDLNLGCIAAYDAAIPLTEAANYIARAYTSDGFWKRDIPGCDPFRQALAALHQRVSTAEVGAVSGAAQDLSTITAWVLDITRPESEASLVAHQIDILTARAIGDGERAEVGLATLLTEPYRSHPLQSYFVRDLEARNAALEVGAEKLTALFATPAELPVINTLLDDMEDVIRGLIGSMPPDEMRRWIEKHSSVHFDSEFRRLEVANWRLGERDPEMLGAWALEVAKHCTGTGSLSAPYIVDQVGCAGLALDLAEQSLTDRAAGLSIARDPLDGIRTIGFTTEDDVADPSRFAANLRAHLSPTFATARLDTIDELAVAVLAETEPDWASELASAVPGGQAPITEWLSADEAVLLLSLDRATVIRNGQVHHALLDVPLNALVNNTRALRASMRQQGLGDFAPVRVRAAWDLWQMLFSPIAAELEGAEHIWIQAPPVIQQVPFEALVTRAPSADAWAVGDPAPGWLIERFSVSIIPSLNSLSGLRAAEHSSGAQALLGLGAPDVAGNETDLRTIEALMTGSLVDPKKVAGLAKLDDAQDELELLSQAVGVGNSTLYTGPAMTHTALSKIPWSDYRTIVFATHGLVASQPSTAVRALLALSPQSDGAPAHLEPADIEGYSLDANLVILAACDTGIVDDPGDEFGLSLFANAFIESGARTVVVSKWPLLSREAWRFSKPLMTADTPGRVARVLRQVRLDIAQSSDDLLAHPAFWASLTVVGDVRLAD